MRKAMLVLMTALVAGAAFANALTDAALSSVRVTAPAKAAAKGGRMLMAAAPDSGCKVTLAFTGERDEVFPLPVTRGSNFEFDFSGDQVIVPVYYIVKEANPPKETQYPTPTNGHYVVTIMSDTRIEVVCRRPIYVDGGLPRPHIKDDSTGYYPGNALRTIQEGVDLALDGAEVRVLGGRSYAPFAVTNRELRITTFTPVDPSVADWTKPAVIDGGGTNRCVEVVDMWTNVLQQVTRDDPAYEIEIGPATNGQVTVVGFTLTNGYTKADGGAVWMPNTCIFEAADCLFVTNSCAQQGGAVVSSGNAVQPLNAA